MVIFTKRESNRLYDLLYDYGEEEKSEQVNRAITNTLRYFTENKYDKHVDLMEHYFKRYSHYSKEYTDGGILRYLCDNIVQCSHTSGYDYLEDIINRFGLELTKLKSF